jgi:hypothetical protein
MLPSRRIIFTKLHLWIRGRQFDEWSAQINLFFILATGRSGTNFLASVLDQAPGATVVHEPVPEDFRAYTAAFYSENAASRYIQGFRRKEIYLRMHRSQHESYGEVNSVLRRHANALQQAFPKANVVHLVRDGRDVVRSMMARRTMTDQDRHTAKIHPHSDDPWYSRWDHMDRFARLCWYWQVENRYLRETIARTVRLESLISNYDYFRQNLLVPCSLNLPASVWENSINLPANATKEHRMPPWPEWGHSRQQTFLDICGEEMTYNGYQVSLT